MPKVFLITGASTGIGAETARQAADAGYKVVLAARSEDKLQALADEIGGLAVRCDVTEWEDQQNLVRRALDEYGQIDVAFANAGFGGARGFDKDDVEHWKSMVLTNVYGCALTIRATMPALKESKGHLLLTSSVAGRRSLPGSLYSASKHAVTAMGEAAGLACQCLQLVLGAGGKDDLVAGFGSLAGGGGADARAGTGDEEDLRHRRTVSARC